MYILDSKASRKQRDYETGFHFQGTGEGQGPSTESDIISMEISHLFSGSVAEAAKKPAGADIFTG